MTSEDCDLCRGERHHPTEHLGRAEDPKCGDVVFVRAVVERAYVHTRDIEVLVREYEPGYRQRYCWRASVNSVDVFPTESSSGKSASREADGLPLRS